MPLAFADTKKSLSPSATKRGPGRKPSHRRKPAGSKLAKKCEAKRVGVHR